jgi:hypothetical protein
MTFSTQTIQQFCKELHPEAKTDSDAVLIYQKELQKIIDLKNKFNVPAATDIEFWFLLHEAWNELKAEELFINGGKNVLDNNCNNTGSNNPVVLVGDQTCGDLSAILQRHS